MTRSARCSRLVPGTQQTRLPEAMIGVLREECGLVMHRQYRHRTYLDVTEEPASLTVMVQADPDRCKTDCVREGPTYEKVSYLRILLLG